MRGGTTRRLRSIVIVAALAVAGVTPATAASAAGSPEPPGNGSGPPGFGNGPPGNDSGPPRSGSGPPGRAADPGSESLGTNGAPVPEPDWGPCPEDTVVPPGQQLSDYECATAEVPLSYRKPHGQSIELALGRLPAADPDRKIGTLFYNPGGPGGSGRIPPQLTSELHERFDIVGFDPRGTNASTPVVCFTSAEQAQRAFGWQFPVTRAQERDVVEATGRGTNLCARNAGPLLGHMSTANVARDMDLVRQATGDDKLTYLGYSYGTHLGEVYANLFPEKVRALVLDAVLNPIEWTTGHRPPDAFAPFTYRIGSFDGGQKALRSFLDACANDERCAFREPDAGPRELQDKYQTLLDRLLDEPVEISDGNQTVTVTYQTVVGLTNSLLYDASASPILAATLQQLYDATSARARTQTAPPRVDLPDVSTRPTYAPYTGGLEWFQAVSCLDSANPPTPRVWPRYARKADTSARGFGSLWTYNSLACPTWPASDPDRYAGPWDRETANPILLVGNRQGDPATPYPDARSTKRVLANARLLTLDSFGHTAVGGVSSCIDSNVNAYLIDGTLPPAGTTCKPDRQPFDPAPAPLSRVPTESPPDGQR